MINLRRLSSLLSISLLFLLSNLSCKEEQLDESYVARVGDARLTEDELNYYIDSSRFSNKHREEIIREWIDREILSQEAVNTGLNEDPLYKHISSLNEKELLSALLIQKEIKSEAFTFSDQELQHYFDENIEEFKLHFPAVMINRADFSDKQTAINFRSQLISDGWNVSIENFQTNNFYLNGELEKFIYKYQINSARLFRVISELMPGEYSIVVESEPNLFSIVQLIKSFDENETPSFEFVKNLVKERYAILKKKQFYSNYKKELYNKYNVEIVRNDK